MKIPLLTKARLIRARRKNVRSIFFGSIYGVDFMKKTSCIYGNLLYIYRHGYSPALWGRTFTFEVGMNARTSFATKETPSLTTNVEASSMGKCTTCRPKRQLIRQLTVPRNTPFRGTIARLNNVNGLNHHFNVPLLQWTGYCCVVSCQSTVQLCIVTSQHLTSLL